MREKEYSADTTDLMTRDLDGYAVRARELLRAPVELRTINNSADEIGSIQYTWRNFINWISPTAIVLAVLISVALGLARSARNDPRVSARQLVLIWLTKHTEKTLPTLREPTSTPLVGTISEPAASRIDMNRVRQRRRWIGDRRKDGEFSVHGRQRRERQVDTAEFPGSPAARRREHPFRPDEQRRQHCK